MSLNYPISIKGVVLHQGRVLLLLNERDEWDLPGGRPDAGEDHRTALVREVCEEAGLAVEAGAFIGEHLFEVLPQRFVRIVAYICKPLGDTEIAPSHEHRQARWIALADLDERVAGYLLPTGYLGAIRQAARQPLSP
ncbi:NUDIX domain-containing protein [uncultured Reyranella sp.]|uniref:NUDIX domain-containing protein n=1 Tax=uncultured Reyranella sp. TaxID=735512 RepID=UPI002600D892|nr:NUDIX domain-containing protein [uncultured Reyranella sp.]